MHLMGGPGQCFFFQCGPEMPKGWTPLQVKLSTWVKSFLWNGEPVALRGMLQRKLLQRSMDQALSARTTGCSTLSRSVLGSVEAGGEVAVPQYLSCPCFLPSPLSGTLPWNEGAPGSQAPIFHSC